MGSWLSCRWWKMHKGRGLTFNKAPSDNSTVSILELNERYTMTLQYLPHRQHPPHILLQRQIFNTLLQLPLILQLPPPTSPCCGDILPPLPTCSLSTVLGARGSSVFSSSSSSSSASAPGRLPARMVERYLDEVGILPPLCGRIGVKEFRVLCLCLFPLRWSLVSMRCVRRGGEEEIIELGRF